MTKKFIENLPKKFRQNVAGLCGQEGLNWLKNLPQTIKQLENKWKIKFDKQFENLSYNFVGTCHCRDTTPAVIKIALPLREPEIFNEARSLQIIEGKGATRLLKIDKDHQAILIEKLTPGEHLKELFADNKEDSVDIAIALMKRLYQEASEETGFTTVDYWLNKLTKVEDSEIFSIYLEKARRMFDKLNSDKTKIKFIHGDLHHENILSVDNNNFKAIDPFGMNANVGYEIGVFLRNHSKWVENEESLLKAVGKFADAFNMSENEIKHWTFVQQVISSCWDYEDNNNGNWKNAIAQIKLWERL